ncbi:S-layer homology domain-containing protein [Acutalibacter sp. JLR.KK004]|uniref:S-layer homology domain-containing protein n=1 Tax=Acutalibacter sp. JLR.KK004 TaxID=3112622 RepID=UPI002FF07F33
MNKSKFLKKSLAAVLAVLMIAAMIPLSAAAAYEPTGVKPVPAGGFSGEVTGSGYNWNIAFNYNAGNLPKIKVETGHADDQVSQVKKDGTQITFALASIPTELTAERDDDGNPLPIIFEIRKGTDDTNISARYTVNWIMGAPAGSASVKSAKMDNTYDGVVDETAKTITFTVPFGYAGSKAYTVELNGCKGSSVSTTAFGSTGTATPTNSIALTSSGIVGTNTTKAVAQKLTTTTEDALSDVAYDIFVVEEEGLKSIKIGDYEGVFKMKASPDQDYQDGNIEFAVPADLAKDANGALKLVPTFEVGSHYSNAVLATAAAATAKITSGTEFDFAYMFDQAATGATLTLTSITGSTRTYTLKFVPNDKDTTLTGVTVSNNAGATGATYKVEGTIEGENINVVVPKEADLSKVNLAFNGPKAITSSSKKPSVKAPSTGTAVDFDAAGVASGTNLNNVNCTDPVKVLVTAADDKTQKYYTLTVTKADATELQPTITAAKLVLNKGKDDEYTSNGVVDTPNRTITFTVPHSTLENDVRPSATVEYTFAKSQSSFIEMTGVTGKGTLDSATVKDGGLVTVSAGGGDGLTYAVKYVRATPETGKSITNFVLTTADNKNLINYNNNKAFTVTPADGKFKVTVADDSVALYPSFELSKGAKMYTANDAKTPVTGPDEDGVLTQWTATAYADGTAKYFVADEKLATLIALNDSSVATYVQIKNKYAANMVEYTFETKEEARTGNRLKTISGLDGNITGTIGGANGDEITLTVPYSYRNGKEFFLDFETDAGAAVTAERSGSKPAHGAVYSGGKVDYVDGKIVPVSSISTWGENVAFKVEKSGDNYILKAGGEAYWEDVTTAAAPKTLTLTVTSESGVAKPYKIKEVKVADANTGAEITAAKVNGVSASINQTAETITASVPFGTNLGQIKLELTASKMASVTIDRVVFDADKTYDLRKPAKVAVQSEKGDKTTVYTLTVKTGEQFSDVPANAWFAPYVKEAFEKNIVQGIGEGLFGPYTHISREDFAVMTGRMLGIKVDENATVPFKDASSVSGYAKGYVAYFAEEGIIGGYEDSTFKPKNNITREEAAKILAVALDLEVTGTPTFADTNKISGWARPYVAAVQTAKVFNGDEANRFNGTTRITRAETAKVMVDSLKIK